MKTKPMLCKGSVVRAMLSGRQTQDRRPIKPQPADDISPATTIPDDGIVRGWKSSLANEFNKLSLHIPAYETDDIIWVRETYGLYNPGNPDTGLPNRDETKIIYPATDKVPEVWFDADDMLYENCPRPLPMRPSIHMPKWACRLFLKVNAVRVERIQNISRVDCASEGWTMTDEQREQVETVRLAGIDDGYIDDGAIEWFHDLWESLYPGSWDRNPWVWVYEFERTDKPADWPTN